MHINTNTDRQRERKMRNEFAELLDLMSLWPDTRPYRKETRKQVWKKKLFSPSPLLTISLPHNGIHF
jgi:hypothetical protein